MGFYHVCNRGNARADIFLKAADFEPGKRDRFDFWKSNLSRFRSLEVGAVSAIERWSVMQHQATHPDLLRPAATVLFWITFYGLGVLILLLTLRSFGKTSPVAILLQAAVAVWVLTTVFQLLRWKVAYLIAAAWVLMLGLPLAFQVVRRMHHWLTIGMDAPDGMGSPMAFLLGFVLEWVVFAPLCFMLAVLVVLRPWRGDCRAAVA